MFKPLLIHYSHSPVERGSDLAGPQAGVIEDDPRVGQAAVGAEEVGDAPAVAAPDIHFGNVVTTLADTVGDPFQIEHTSGSQRKYR